MNALTVCTFKWRGSPIYRTRYHAWHVNRMHAMMRRCLHLPFQFVCVTDDAQGLDDSIRVVPLWRDHAHVPNPHGAAQPACYRRLKLFSAEAAELVGERILWIDLDMVLTGDITPLVDRPVDFVLLPTSAPNIPVNGSMVLLTPGAAEDVWTSFDPATSPGIAQRAGCFGSDQGWIAWHLLHGALRDKADLWRPGPKGDGIYFYGEHMRRAQTQAQLPDDARVVSFHGRGEPWARAEQQLRWVQQHYGAAEYA